MGRKPFVHVEGYPKKYSHDNAIVFWVVPAKGEYAWWHLSPSYRGPLSDYWNTDLLNTQQTEEELIASRWTCEPYIPGAASG